MKKLIAILLFAMLVPFSAYSMEMLSDDVMQDVTGQAGVAIAADVEMQISMEMMAWGDSDGAGAGTTGGYIGMKDITIGTVRIKLDHELAAGAYTDPILGGTGPGAVEFFSIDVATSDGSYAYTQFDGVTAALNAAPVAGQTFVHIVLGTQLITMEGFQATIAMGAYDADDSAVQLTQALGVFTMGDFQMRIHKGSFVDIWATQAGAGAGETESGVSIAFNVAMSVEIADMSWGDTDGAGTAIYMTGADDTDPYLFAGGDLTNAGYIGMTNIEIGLIRAMGTVTIDVATIDGAAIAGVDPTQSMVLGVYAGFLAANPGAVSPTAVLIGLDNVRVSVASFGADIVLAPTSDLSAAAGGYTMGRCLMRGLDMTINGWVGIAAK